TASSPSSFVRPYALIGAGGSSSDRGDASGAGPAAARLDTYTSRAPTARAAFAVSRVASAFPLTYSSSPVALTTPARWTIVSTPSSSVRSASALSGARTTRARGGG